MNKCPFCRNTLINGRHRLTNIDTSNIKNLKELSECKEIWECLDEKRKFECKISEEELGNATEEIKNEYINRKLIFLLDLKINHLTPEDSKAFKDRGIAYYELGNYKQAIGDFDQAINFAPQDGENYYFRGKCNEQLGKNDLADRDFRSASSKGFKNSKENKE